MRYGGVSGRGKILMIAANGAVGAFWYHFLFFINSN